MTIKATYQALQTIITTALPEFTMYGMYKDQYNTVNSIKDNVIIIEPPRQWPMNYRNTCESTFETKVWIGLRQDIKPATGGTFEHPPFNEIDVRDTLVMVANVLTQAISKSTSIRINGEFDGDGDLITLYDAPEGQSTNWQAWGQFSINLTAFGTVTIPPVYPIPTPTP
jgi:hypothetical protein